MEITDILAQMGGLQSMARELGVSEKQVASGAADLHPAKGRRLPDGVTPRRSRFSVAALGSRRRS